MYKMTQSRSAKVRFARGILKDLSVAASCSLVGLRQLFFYVGFESIASAASTASK